MPDVVVQVLLAIVAHVVLVLLSVNIEKKSGAVKGLPYRRAKLGFFIYGVLGIGSSRPPKLTAKLL